MRHIALCSVALLALGLGAPALAQHRGGHSGHSGGHRGGGHVGGGHVGGHVGNGHVGRGHRSFGSHGRTHGSRHHRGHFSIGLGFGWFGYPSYGSYYSGFYPSRPGYGGFGYVGSGWRVLEPDIGVDPLLRDWVMLRFDANGSGRLGRDEARAANDAFWALADRDGDGSASDEEWGAARDVAAQELQSAYGVEAVAPDGPSSDAKQQQE